VDIESAETFTKRSEDLLRRSRYRVPIAEGKRKSAEVACHLGYDNTRLTPYSQPKAARDNREITSQASVETTNGFFFCEK
jgi:hypothetical protein